MDFFLALQHTYTSVEYALFGNAMLLEKGSINKLDACKALLAKIEQLLTHHSICMSNVNFIAVNQGPGPFTTMRVVITIANGISFAKKIPLIGIDGMKTLMKEYPSTESFVTISLLNAFGRDVYFGIPQDHNSVKIGYGNIESILHEIKKLYPSRQLCFIGNATLLYQEKITSLFNDHCILPKPLPETCSIEKLGLEGYQQWLIKKDITFNLQPLYLKRSLT